MGNFETEGIILKSYSLAEADKIVVIFTEKFGLIRGVAKGAKRLKSKFGGNLEPFSVVTLDLYQKEERELVSIRNVELQKSFFDLAGNPQILQKLAYLSELLAEFSPPHDPNERIYRMAKICFQTIVEKPETIDLIVFYFEFWLLKLGGYLPDWERCNVCGENFTETENSNLQMSFHLICDRCRKTKTNQTISGASRQMFLRAKNYSPAKFIDVFGHQKVFTAELSEILRRIINQILNRELVSKKFMISAP